VIDDPRFAEGVALFQARHWFEAHEVLELLWRATPPGPDKLLFQGLIQLAVSLEHWRRRNPRGARGQWEKGRAKLDGLPSPMHGLDLAELLESFRRFYGARALEHWVEAQKEGVLPPEEPGPWPTPRWVDSVA
jgi:predicted metal-dependent hydrolase